MAEELETAGIDRRSLIKKGAVATGVVWAAPVMVSVEAASAQAAGSGWDKSSLTAGAIDCSAGTAVVCNSGSGTGLSPVSYEVLYAASGQAKNGAVVANGTIPALGASGNCGTVNFSAAVAANGTGNYVVKFIQPPGHPGQGVLFSAQCSA